MKKLLCLFGLITFVLLSGCSGFGSVQANDDLMEIPADASQVYQYNFIAETGINVGHGNWNADGTGYFIVEVDFQTGSYKKMEVYDAYADNNVILRLDKDQINGRYITPIDNYSNSHLGIRFKNLTNANGKITVYFVKSNQ